MLYPADEDMDVGSLNLSWPYKTEWNDWEYTIGDRSGSIHQKWFNDPHHWELIDGEYIVSIKRLWRDDNSIWTIKCDDYNIRYQSKYKNDNPHCQPLF